jgi:hypothetical protein
MLSFLRKCYHFWENDIIFGKMISFLVKLPQSKFRRDILSSETEKEKNFHGEVSVCVYYQ